MTICSVLVGAGLDIGLPPMFIICSLIEVFERVKTGFVVL